MRTMGAAILGGLQDNPSVAAGICTFAVAFALVAGNALYGQKGGHPVPLFTTRDATTTRSVPAIAEPPIRRAAPRPDERPAQIPVPEMRPRSAAPAPALAATGSSLVAEAQTALREAGFYSGEVDGLFGPKTREAVLRFEQAAGLAQTGLVSAELARHAAEWRSGPGAVAEARPAAQTAVADDPRPAAITVAATPADSIAPGPETVTFDIRDVRDAALIARIQIGLINFGEAGISVDGMIGERTISAIRNFQSRYGLPVTGMPDDAVLRKMEQIGALKAG